jgi:hypothetical protein
VQDTHIRDGSFRSGNNCAPEIAGGSQQSRAHVKEREAQNQRDVEIDECGAEGADETATIEEIIERVQENLLDESWKPSAADLFRLLELRHELGQVEAGPLTVQWVDECETAACEE